MKTKQALSLFLLVGLIISCDSNSPEDVVLLRSDGFTGAAESWVYISNQNGRLLDLRKTSDEEGIIEFEGVAHDWIVVTEVSVSSFDINGEIHLQHKITSYWSAGWKHIYSS